MEKDGNLYVKYRVIGKNKVAVPTHFFKVEFFWLKNIFHLVCISREILKYAFIVKKK